MPCEVLLTPPQPSNTEHAHATPSSGRKRLASYVVFQKIVQSSNDTQLRSSDIQTAASDPGLVLSAAESRAQTAESGDNCQVVGQSIPEQERPADIDI